MATKTNIGAGITLDGERQFKAAITEINNGLKVTASTLALVTAQFSNNATSVAALTAKNEQLENRISSQTEKIAKLREALAHAATTYGEADKRTMDWQVSVNKAEIELIKMNEELDQNKSQLQQAQKDMQKYGLSADEVADKTTGFGNKIGDLANALGINLPAGADKAIRALDGTKLSTMALVGVVTGLIAGFGKLTIDTAKTADEILRLSEVTGLSTDTIQGMNYAAELVDVSAETITGSMRKMIRSMSDAQNGSKEARQAFKDLHISITNNGRLKDSEQMFYELVDALGRVKNETERDAISMQIFGKSAQELNPLINSGSKSLKEFVEQAKEAGYSLDYETLKALEKLDTSMKQLDNQTQAVKNSLAIVLLPVLTGFFELLNKIDPKILATVAIIGTVAVVAITVVKGIESITDTFKALDTKSLKTTAIIVGAVAALIALAAIIAVIVGKGGELNRTMSGVGSSVGDMVGIINGAGNRVGHNALGTNNWRGGYTWVGEEGPEIVNLPAGSKIYSNRQSRQMVNNADFDSGGGNTIINLSVNMSEVDEVYKLVNVCKRAKQTQRMGYAGV
jgi:hypothetical protein